MNTNFKWLRAVGCAITLIFLSGLNALAAKQPNVLFIFIDDQGYYDLGCYGATEVKLNAQASLGAALGEPRIMRIMRIGNMGIGLTRSFQDIGSLK